MYTANDVISSAPSQLTPVEMPLDVLLALPDYATRDPAAPVFNLPAVVGDLLGQFGWERARSILRLRVWAPEWSDDALGRFATSPFSSHPEFFRGSPLQDLRLITIPLGNGAASPGNATATPHDIVHFLGNVEWHDGDRALRISEKQGIWVDAVRLTRDLLALNTRLLILQVPARSFEDSVKFVRVLVSGGVHAALVVAAASPGNLDSYLADIYANVIHNKDLTGVCQPSPTVANLDEVQIHLDYRQGFETTLRFDAWLSSLEQRLDQLNGVLANTVAESPARSAAIRVKLESSRTLHATQRSQIAAKLNDASVLLPSISLSLAHAQREIKQGFDFAHEHGGAEPLSRIAELVPALENGATQARRLYTEIDEQIDDAESNAPRVMNANFADAGDGRMLGKRDGLEAGKEYDLLVDVGHAWDKNVSIVDGVKEFPEQALPAEKEGHRLKVVFASADLEPHLVAGQMWLPAGHGRSHPMVEGEPAQESGPLRLRLKVPAADQHGAVRRTMHGRLFIYYENNLLQAATVTAAIVAKAGRPLQRENVIDVDYALTSTFGALQESFAHRKLRLSPADSSTERSIGLNITLNQDGAGTHRILIQGNDDVSPAWTTYDPIDAMTCLSDARDALINCFWQKDSNGVVVSDENGNPVSALSVRNGKDFEQFQFDLFFLAKVGRSLFNKAFLGLQTDGNATWESRFRQRLAKSTVIQIARLASTPANYVFPWGLLYDYPLGTAEELKVCQVIYEWSSQGVRTKPVADSCPYADLPEHKENILCPYGFWGLKHVIEQPLAPALGKMGLREAVKKIPFGPNIRLSIGWTRDQSLDLKGIDAHLQRIEGIGSIRLADPRPNPADDRSSVRALLGTPNVVYFLCHCERAPTDKEPYLHVGPRDDLEKHKIYVNTILDWRGSTLATWQTLSPLVFINGCHTSDLKPGEVLNFVSAFARAGAAGVIGTEVNVRLPVAMEIAEILFTKLVNESTIGEATREMRWELANKGNLLGLCYSAYGLADLQLVKN